MQSTLKSGQSVQCTYSQKQNDQCKITKITTTKITYLNLKCFTQYFNLLKE